MGLKKKGFLLMDSATVADDSPTKEEEVDGELLSELDKLKMVKPGPTSGRPPKFRQCPICNREFGSRSLDIHISACAEKHGKEVPESFLRQQKQQMNIKTKRRSRGQSSSTEEKDDDDDDDDDDDVETSEGSGLGHSWPNSSMRKKRLGMTHQQRNHRYLRRRRNKERRLSRPRTAVLAHPTILDETLKDKVDMTMTKKEFLQAFKLVSPAKRSGLMPGSTVAPRRHPGAPVGYRRGSGPGPGPSRVVASPPSSVVLNKRAEFSTKVPLRAPPRRPGTTTLSDPTNPAADLPRISSRPPPPTKLPTNPRLALKAARAAKMAAAAAELSDDKGVRRASLQSKDPLTSPERRTLWDQHNHAHHHHHHHHGHNRGRRHLRRQESVPEPCNSCGRSDLPERFHTHPPNENEPGNNANPPSPTKIPVLSPRKANNTSKDKENDGSSDNKKRNDNKVLSSNNNNKTTGSPYRKASLPVTTQRQTRRKVRNLSNKSVDISDLDLKSSSDTEAVRRRNKPKKETKVTKEEEDINKSPERASADESDNQNSTSSNGSSGSTGTTVNSSSNTRTKCSVCGKEFGKNSLRFHEPQCKRKEAAQKARKLREEKEREEKSRENATYFVPPPEEEGEKDGPFDETFEAIWEAHVQQLIPCSICGRTFFPDRIEVHSKWCKGAKPQKSNSVISLQSVTKPPKASSTSPTRSLTVNIKSSNNSDNNNTDGSVISLLDAASNNSNSNNNNTDNDTLNSSSNSKLITEPIQEEEAGGQ